MKAALWDRIRARIKPQFERVGITRCELRRQGCTGGMYLGFAHAQKRRNLTAETYDVVILACTSCHQQIERLPEADMKAVVEGVIARRPRQPSEKQSVLYIPA